MKKIKNITLILTIIIMLTGCNYDKEVNYFYLFNYYLLYLS